PFAIRPCDALPMRRGYSGRSAPLGIVDRQMGVVPNKPAVHGRGDIRFGSLTPEFAADFAPNFFRSTRGSERPSIESATIGVAVRPHAHAASRARSCGCV